MEESIKKKKKEKHFLWPQHETQQKFENEINKPDVFWKQVLWTDEVKPDRL